MNNCGDAIRSSSLHADSRPRVPSSSNSRGVCTSWHQIAQPTWWSSDNTLASSDVAELNLVCAHGLPGAEDLDIPAGLKTLDEWAALVRSGTERMLPQFRGAPQEYNGSEGYFRILVMVTVLQRNLGIEYNPECMQGPADCSDSRDLFLHGLLETRQGTCVSMPVLYVAIARRLGYPVRLVGAKQHLFARWDNREGERFNIECTSRGLLSYPDEYYHRWPVPLTATDLEHGYYLHSYSPREELACFAATRGHCFRDWLQLPAALDAFWLAHQLAPRDPNYRGFWAIATVLHKHLERLVDYRLDEKETPAKVLENGVLRPLESWETWAVPRAREEFHRIRAIAAGGTARR